MTPAEIFPKLFIVTNSSAFEDCFLHPMISQIIVGLLFRVLWILRGSFNNLTEYFLKFSFLSYQVCVSRKFHGFFKAFDPWYTTIPS